MLSNYINNLKVNFMKKKILFVIFGVVLVVVGGFFGERKPSDELLMENVEALTDGEVSGSSCGGAKEWSTSGGLFHSKKEFYDCKCILRTGYNPKGNCM